MRYGARARRIHLSKVHPTGDVDCVCEQSVWFFAKKKAHGCRCRKSMPGNPKLAGSLCHGGGYCYHPTVVERIRGKRLCIDWTHAMRGMDALDVEL